MRDGQDTLRQAGLAAPRRYQSGFPEPPSCFLVGVRKLCAGVWWEILEMLDWSASSQMGSGHAHNVVMKIIDLGLLFFAFGLATLFNSCLFKQTSFIFPSRNTNYYQHILFAFSQ